ncbi:MAG: hypothetical protein K2I10_14945 [Lachnospiraceae bacterium]|nr:hypothetical protein [Lachnospiraceae bacterium]
MRKVIFFLALFLFLMTSVTVRAADYNLESGKYVSGDYAGDGEEDYNYFRIQPSKSGYIALTVKTSDKKPLMVDICDSEKNVIASNVDIGNKKTVLHKTQKKKIYYVRIKGKKDASYQVSYKLNTFDTLKYAKKYNYTFTNASFTSEKNAITFKAKANRTGNLQFMCDVNNVLAVRYLNSKKSSISKDVFMTGKVLSGIGVQNKSTYYIRIWNAEGVAEGTTDISDMKFQIPKGISTASAYSVRSRAKVLRQGTYQETLVQAGKTSTAWYKIDLNQKKKIKISVESRMFQNNGKCLQVTLYNKAGKKLNSKAIVIEDKVSVTNKNKKYKMKYPVKHISPTVKFPAGTYYVKITSSTKTSSGSYRIKWD